MVKGYILNRAKLLIYLNCGIDILFLCGLFIYSDLINKKLLLIIVFTYCLKIIVAALYIFIVKNPYKKVKNELDSFVSDKSYEKIFTYTETLSPELKDVFRELKEILDKSNILDLSIQQARYLALQNQINPHFLYNTLESIRSDALYGGMDDIAIIIESLSLFFQYTISDMDKKSTLSDELENVGNYFIIQKYRFEERLELNINISKECKINTLTIPKLTLQPIVENAIIHGLEGKKGVGIIEITAELTDRGYYVFVSDNGLGIEEENLRKINEELSNPRIITPERKKGGIALRNVAQRIKLLYGEQYGIHVYSTKDIGTKVVAWLPVTKEVEV